jgi:hypothetical protein
MAWEKPADSRPVWCTVNEDKEGVPTAQSVSCTTKDPDAGGPEVAALELPGLHGTASDVGAAMPAMPVYKKFTSQDELGHFLLDHYKIRNPKDLTSCEVCHR